MQTRQRKFLPKRRSLALVAALISLLTLNACESANPVASPGLSSPLEDQLDEAARLNLQSARNSLQQAQNLYFQLSAPLISVSTDVPVYRRLVNDMLPAMLSAANSLTVSSSADSEQAQLKAEYQELYSEAMTQIVQGINTNLAVYQGMIEAPQSLDGSAGANNARQALAELTALFQATEYAERFSAQLAAFPSLLSNASAVLTGIRNQQSVVINGVLKLSEQADSAEAVQASYQTLVQTLTRPELLNQVAQLARRAFGDSRVALRQSELTPVQPDPNQIQLVVREETDRYRLIRISEGRLVNEVMVDTRGLSAADLLFQSNVVVVTSPQP